MMKKITYVLAGLFMFVSVATIVAQTSQQQCAIDYNLFKGDYQTKKYEAAKEKLNSLLDNCPTLSINIYKLGARIAEVTNDNDLMKRVYEMHLANFPNKEVAKAHSDYATWLVEKKLASDDEIFAILEKAYKISPEEMGIKNIYRYFQGVTDRYKDTDPQKVFDTYDDVVESVTNKLENYSKKIDELQKKQASGSSLSKKEERNLKNYTINSKALGTVEDGLDHIISSIATCDRLIPLLGGAFEENKNNATWLRRAVSRLYNKGCQSDPLFEKISRAYAEASPSSDSYTFLANVLEKNGDVSGAEQMRSKAFNLETDPYKKSKYKLKFAQEAADSGEKSKARSLAMEALQFNPNNGKAYLFIAGLYAKSANSCGSNEFEKRMVYVAAANKARQAAQVDPSIASKANDFASAYMKHAPSKKLVFQQGVSSGSSYRVGCWIGETVRVP
ncbi:tetratricopeptide repeat protein [Tenacibaculum sp. UWU-22]|uniref:tetratricopeptide repeat protein n=1 Tax=Tenacibaculum sp. UWU-22 TaxID=3234187 RepID=UPI0034DAEC48